MSSPIVLPPSNDQHALVNAIRQAATTDRTLLLEPGIHYTAPGVLQMIPIGPQGLHIGSTNPLPFPIDPGAPSAAKTMIKRPDHSISQAAPNFNYGLFFIPSPPTKSEIAAAVWKPFQDSSGPFEFAVVMRGSVNIGGLLVDSNMGKQNLESAPEHAAEHSAMLGFSGFRYDAPAGPDGIKRHIYIGFQSITLQELTCFNGGYADDIWFPFAGGAFHPNIEQVLIRRVISGRRLDPHRGTITFSALAKKIDIQDANIYQLHAESDADWKAAPRKDDTFTPSQWNLDQIQTQVLIFSVQGKVVQLNARRLTATTACEVELAGGKISDSHFTVQPGKSSRFFRLDRLSFENVAWLLKANDQGAVDGLQLGARFNDTCIASFHKNSFRTSGTATSGQLINSTYSAAELGNSVTATFRECAYEVGFGSAASPNTKVAVVQERGTWTFAKEDFRDRDPRKAILKGPQADVVLIIEPSKRP